MAEITLEQVEKLRARSDLSYEEARTLLEACGGSVLDALIELERQGRAKVPQGGGQGGTAPGRAEKQTPPRPNIQVVTGSTWENFWKDARDLLGRAWEILRHCNLYQLRILREDKPMSAIPIWVVLVMFFVAFYVAVPLLVVGLFLGCRYEIVKEE